MEFLCPAIKDNAGVPTRHFCNYKNKILEMQREKELGGMGGKCLERHELTDGRKRLIFLKLGLQCIS